MNLTNGYNGHLTSREAGSVGGQMVKNVCPIRTARFIRKDTISGFGELYGSIFKCFINATNENGQKYWLLLI